MKKIKRFAYAGAVLLLSAGFAACSSTDDALENSNYIERGAVKTEFNISIPGKAKTRMSEGVTQAQATPIFRGMENIVLIPYAKGGAIVATDNRLGDNLVLNYAEAVPTITTNKNNAITSLNTGNNSQLYKDVEVPIGTKSFLFYGVATATAADNIPEGATADQVDGKLNPQGLTDATPNTIKFDLQNIVAANAETDAKATKIVEYLNLIAKNNDWDGTTNILHTMYTEFIKLRAGSSADVQAVVTDLYNSLKDKTDATSKKVVEDILNTTYVEVTTTTEGDVTTTTPVLENGKIKFKEIISGYPANIYLPDGAALVNWNNGFEVAIPLSYDSQVYDNENNLVSGFLFNVPTLQDYVYPASLYYRANSQINVSTTSKASYYTSESTWPGVLGKYEGVKGAVSGETKSIAIYDQVEYAVGRMDLKVKANASTLQDNDNVAFDATKFQVTGVLIGGQKQVDFEFLPVSAAAEKTIYDNQTEGISLNTGNPVLANRTLVLETEDEVVVKFAIELVNNGAAFRGVDGIVPTGCKFYLIGQINPAVGGTPIAGGEDNRQTDKDEEAIIRVFLQDFVTTINASVENLKHAYNVVPDLRAPKLELGLSVNLDWNAANTYSVTME